MKAKRTFSLLLLLILAFSIAFTFASCGEETPKKTECTSHKDANFDKKCDECGADYTAPCTSHKDENKDNKCDYCTADTTPVCTEHKDEDKDKKCDTCGADFIAECTEHTDTDADNKCDYCTADITPTCTEHKDENKDKKCDECGEDFIGECAEHKDADEDSKCDYCGASTPLGKAVLISDGIANFHFVIANGSSADINRTIGTLINTMRKLGVEADSVFDSTATEQPCEVLVGSVTSRGEKYSIDNHYYGWNGYAIKQIDGKVVIIGGSDEALIKAISEFEKEILGINKKTKELINVTMTAKDNIEKVQDDYTVKSVMLGANDLRDYVIVADMADAAEYSTATTVQEHLYKKTGIWLNIVTSDSEYDKGLIFNLSTPKTCSSEKGFIIKFVGDDMLFDCGFANKIEEAILSFFVSEITNSKKPAVEINANYKNEKIDYKNVYYEDFGAVGNGIADDFFAIQATHKYANQWGNTVNANPNATYYLGEGSGKETITVQTDTNWRGCKFIFDDSTISAPAYDPVTAKPTGAPGDPEFDTSIFTILTGGELIIYYKAELPITTLERGAENIGFTPGYRAMVIPTNSNVKHFIRFGANQDNGYSQTEIIMVEADGSVDPSTPVLWNYETITGLTVQRLDDEPIVINGISDDGKRQTHIETNFNNAPSYYTYYARNILIQRANVTIKGIKHTIINQGLTGAPYSGFIRIENSDNVNVDGCEFQCPIMYDTIGSAGEGVGMGTYEISAATSNNVTWSNCKQSNFFQKDGSIKFGGMMGTNYCKNLTFDNMFVCSFDAHKGTYNAVIKNSTCEHMNFIGEGTILLENVTIYADASKAGIILRSDYGSTWQGDLIINGLDLKYSKVDFLEITRSKWNNHFFGYQTYLPENVYLNNVKTTKISYSVEYDIRSEKVDEVNEMPIHLYYFLERYTQDISSPTTQLPNHPTKDKIKCACTGGFLDENSDGLCDNKGCALPKEADETLNRNPFIPTKKVYITNCPGLKMIFPNTPQFKFMEVYVDGEEVDWFSTGTVEIPKLQ